MEDLMKLVTKKGFTLVEILICMTIIAIMISLMFGLVNYSNQTAQNNAAKLTNDFGAIEAAFVNYFSAKGLYPASLTDATFVPIYLFPPKAPTSFNGAYGTNGYFLGSQTGQASPNNGYYVCAQVTAVSASDTSWLTLTNIGQTLSAQKYFYNTTCPATSNMAAPSSATVIYPTIWLTRY